MKKENRQKQVAKEITEIITKLDEILEAVKNA